LLIVLLLALAPASAAPLPESYRHFLDEEVVYLITPRERDKFLTLQSDAQRDAFIGAFWKARDPVPETEVNERREQNQERLDYANKYLGRGTSRPGWQTDQGRAYILLGKPRTVERYSIEGPTYPLELWFYTGEPGSGLPTAFFLMFIRKRGAGELRLYDPLSDGAASLLPGYESELLPAGQIYRLLRREVSPDVALAAFNLDPSAPFDPRDPRPALANVELLTKIQELPEKLLLRPDYLDRLDQLVEQVATHYVFNPLRIEGRVAPWWDGPDRTHAEIALWLEPQQVTVVQEAGSYILGGSLALTASDLRGNVVASRERRLEIRMTETQFKRASTTPIEILERFPLAPGRYRVAASLRAAQSSELATWSGDLEIRPGVEFAIGPAVAAQVRPDPTSPSESSPTRAVPTVSVLSVHQPLRFLYQLVIPEGEPLAVEVEAILERDDQQACRHNESVQASAGIQTNQIELHCPGLSAGQYLVNLTATAPGFSSAGSSTELRLVDEPRPLPNLIGSPP